MKTIAVTDKSSVQDVLQQGEKEEVVVLRDGHAVAMIIPFDDDDVEWYGKERDPAFLDSIVRGRKQAAAGQTISHEELKRELGID
jgi:hypothetical protein